jgi:hypothetical protein
VSALPKQPEDELGRPLRLVPPPARPPIPAVLIEDRRYAEQIEQLKRDHPDWHIRDGQALRWSHEHYDRWDYDDS